MYVACFSLAREVFAEGMVQNYAMGTIGKTTSRDGTELWEVQDGTNVFINSAGRNRAKDQKITF